MAAKHFLQLKDLEPKTLEALIQRAIALKQAYKQNQLQPILQGKVLGLLFEKSSTRTRVSFEVGMAHLGGQSLFLSPRDLQLGRGETVEDTARVLSRMLDAIVIRTYEHAKLETFAQYSKVPVINGLTDKHHPCQLLADIQTFYEKKGNIQGKTVVYIGDGNNMCHSYIQASELLDFNLRVACPEDYPPDAELLKQSNGHVKLFHNAQQASKDVDMIVTDVWASMGQEEEEIQRLNAFKPFQVNNEIMAQAKTDALFMHCLPAHRGQEVTTEVMESPQSVVWDEAENRLHSQKALLEFLLQ